MTLKDAANLLGVSWDTVKDIHTHHLEYHYTPPSLEGVDSIDIDEFAVRKGHVYKTIVVELKSGRILYVGNGKGADALDGFGNGSEEKALTSSILQQISPPPSSPLYMRIARIRCTCSTISMW